ncbi:large ribosomal RNA subunit accumulation protein YCED homolog 1, chloroplastic-like [Chenopodium quinoa]|uniref:large ribosomal RNA subunit accumulation protein YCED homolog 1, chloroplastic-like n=1 Tax=Chenopodium quinoa TaxID=63459 RepID=UPI000B790B0F|nr:large ribosomal RNA subunit accumulation protein YCED homolog 1, chloroplastic-like [Chenopodium quinoa]XP_021735382.1 large ribosomal RNA subunit accumulation protein YCED homolog 1, chloroplastic-like [Chenopodium quinoa]
MSLVYSMSSVNPITSGLAKIGFQLNKSTFLRHPESGFIQCSCKMSSGIYNSSCFGKPYKYVVLATKASKIDDGELSSLDDDENAIEFDWGDEEDDGSPWEGAIVYRRNPSISHMEYCTTLERLGLGKISSELSRSSASSMGLRVTKAVKDFTDGTPVLISVDVTRKKHKLRLDGIIRTVLSLACNRCGGPAAESVFSNFSLLLTEEPVEEPEVINMGFMFGEDKLKSSAGNVNEEEDDDDALIDLEDRLHFPPERKEIDISKHIRDMVHLEITINAVCDPKCKGLCLNCGTNLNTGVCSCSKQETYGVGYGPLGELRKKMQQT